MKVACVAAILYNPLGQVLLQQRDNKPGLHSPGFWTLWGGKVEEGETPDQAIRRELNEELELDDVPLVWWRMYERPWREGIVIEQHIYTAPFDRPAESLTLHEGQALRYFNRTELPSLPIAFIFHEVLEAFYESFLAEIQPDPRAAWDEHYLRRSSGPLYEPWLESWLPEIDRACRADALRLVLDLGCGPGQDSRYLDEHGYEPVAADFSLSVLRESGAQHMPARKVNLDVRQGLPFAPGAFAAVVANLSLHYFSWQQTQAVLVQVRGCLKRNGLLLARFNSTNDVNHGAAGYPEVERHAYLVGGMYKRFFDRADLETLFAAGWHILDLQKRTITRYSDPKVIWEIIAKRS